MSNLSEEEKEAIEYYQGKEVSFEIEGNMEELKKALGITDNEEDSFESHQIRIQTLLNLIDRLQKELDKEKGYHSELQLRYNIEHDKYLKLKQELEQEKEYNDKLTLIFKEKLNNIVFEVETAWRKFEKLEEENE